MTCMKFPIRTGLTWELQPKQSHCERRPGLNRGDVYRLDEEMSNISS